MIRRVREGRNNEEVGGRSGAIGRVREGKSDKEGTRGHKYVVLIEFCNLK